MDQHILRVRRGNPRPEELAALTAALLTRLAVAGPDSGPVRRRSPAGWRRPERAAMFDGPRSWRAGAAPRS